MRPSAVLTPLLALALAATSARADEPPSPPATTPPPPPTAATQTTTAKGGLPDLDGRWLVLPHITLAQGTGRCLPSLLEVTRKDGKLDLHERHVVLPDAQRDALEKASTTGDGTWNPMPADLAAILAAWDGLQPEQRGVTEITHDLTAKDAFGPDILKEPKTKDAEWVMVQQYTFSPGGGHPIKQMNAFGALREDGREWTGNYTTVTLAAAPFPVPITFNGTFRLIPLEAKEKPAGFVARLFDLFKGCN
jgi:hypothetical protein